MQNQLVGIYILYKLGRMNGKTFDKTIKLKERDLHPVHHSFAEDSNSNSHINGLLYVEDKEATKLYWQKKPFNKQKEFTKFEEIKGSEDLGNEDNTGAGDSTQDLTGIAEIKNKLSAMTKEQLIEFAEKNDYRITKTKGAEKLLAEIIPQIEVEE